MLREARVRVLGFRALMCSSPDSDSVFGTFFSGQVLSGRDRHQPSLNLKP